MKKLSAIGVLVSTVVVAALCGCASKSSDSDSSSPSAQPAASETTTNSAASKPKDKRPLDQRLAVGMTMDQVKEACGNPKNVATNSDGSATWMYNDSEKSFIPNYSLFGGRIHYTTVMFGTDGKVRSWSTGSSGMY